MKLQISDLEEEVKKASEWVQRARRAVPKQNKTRSAHPDKVDFNAVKNLLCEAESMQTEVKEVEEMRAIVSKGNEWLQKMESALAAGEDADVSTLRALLLESEEMPMVMDEQLLLSAEIDARLWAERANKVLTEKQLPLKVRESCVILEVYAHGCFPLQDVRDLLAEMEALRATLPSKFQKVLKVGAETQMRDGLALADTWFQRAKRALGGSGPGRKSANKVTIERIEQLIVESKQLPADVSDRVEQLQTAIEQARIWGAKTRTLLEEIGEWQEGVQGEGDDSAMQEANQEGAKQPDNEVGGEAEPKKKTTVDLLRTLVKEETKLTAEVPEAVILRELVQRVDAWLDTALACKPKGATSGKGRSKAKLTADDARALMEEAALLPVDIAEEVQRLGQLLSDATEWQTKARAMLETAQVVCKEVSQDEHDSTAEGEQRPKKRKKNHEKESDFGITVELQSVQHMHTQFSELLTEAVRTIAVLTREEQVLQMLVGALNWSQRYNELFSAHAAVPRQKLSVLQQLVDDGDRIDHIPLPHLEQASAQLDVCHEQAEKLKRVLGGKQRGGEDYFDLVRLCVLSCCVIFAVLS
jgi:hypothetical protein